MALGSLAVTVWEGWSQTQLNDEKDGTVTVNASGYGGIQGIRVASATTNNANRTRVFSAYGMQSVTTSADMVYGVGLTLQGTPTSTSRVITLAHSTNGDQAFIAVTTDFGLQLLNSSGTVLASSAAGVVSQGTRFFLEGHIFRASDGTGTATFNVDGVNVISATGLTFGSSNMAAIKIGNLVHSSATDAYVDCDVYYVGTGTASDLRSGPVRADVARPTGDDGTNTWTPSTGTDHYAMVDEAEADDGTTYISKAATGIDRFNLSSIAEVTDPEVFAVSGMLRSRYDGGSTASMSIDLMDSGPTQRSGTTTTISTSGTAYKWARLWAYLPPAGTTSIDGWRAGPEINNTGSNTIYGSWFGAVVLRTFTPDAGVVRRNRGRWLI